MTEHGDHNSFGGRWGAGFGKLANTVLTNPRLFGVLAENIPEDIPTDNPAVIERIARRARRILRAVTRTDPEHLRIQEQVGGQIADDDGRETIDIIDPGAMPWDTIDLDPTWILEIPKPSDRPPHDPDDPNRSGRPIRP